MGRQEWSSQRPGSFCRLLIAPNLRHDNSECFDPLDPPKIRTGSSSLSGNMLSWAAGNKTSAEARRYAGRVVLEPTPKLRRGNVRESALVKEWLTGLGGIRKLGPDALRWLRKSCALGRNVLGVSEASCPMPGALGSP